MLKRYRDGRFDAEAGPSCVMLTIAITETNYALGDSWSDDVFHTTSSQHVWNRRGCSGHNRETISYIGYNSKYSGVQLQGLNIICKLLVKRAER